MPMGAVEHDWEEGGVMAWKTSDFKKTRIGRLILYKQERWNAGTRTVCLAPLPDGRCGTLGVCALHRRRVQTGLISAPVNSLAPSSPMFPVVLLSSIQVRSNVGSVCSGPMYTSRDGSFVWLFLAGVAGLFDSLYDSLARSTVTPIGPIDPLCLIFPIVEISQAHTWTPGMGKRTGLTGHSRRICAAMLITGIPAARLSSLRRWIRNAGHRASGDSNTGRGFGVTDWKMHTPTLGLTKIRRLRERKYWYETDD
ncbi:hypothetical protein GLOTRDRAFT_91341 [Gloeophyllum trabeum ATCC 11539]|uniref:Uncharacterized protein n=1 Tax=Gloeophyllum trabeum (strain ATCC 11539 / FP-39264 / Madison 617) TaxID=670483 RepID=S7QKH2_GLOTA|nr:uncharacterized protein GLOTRDRAFT_91341 [Gloeophyllum trabeum ATCC 11539]EPQ59887.1 hypothetical protein GLOTRDRAFT_91341 [Gloeophyllum trabeum ATCC 11539]